MYILGAHYPFSSNGKNYDLFLNALVIKYRLFIIKLKRKKLVAHFFVTFYLY